MTILTSVTEIEDRIVEGVRDIQRPVVDYVRKSVEQAEGRLPKIPAPKVSYRRVSYPKLNLPEIDLPELSYPQSFPLRDELAEVVETQVAFAKALFETQRTFVTELVDAVSPLVETGTAARAAATTTTTTTTTGADVPVVEPTPATPARKPVTKVTRKPAAKAKATRSPKTTRSTKTTKA